MMGENLAQCPSHVTHGYSMTAKRICELCFLAISVVPAILVVAALSAVLMWRGGPILYRGARLDAAGRPFMMLKFRTLAAGCAGPVHSSDAQVAPFERFLRRTRLDEVPQLLHVLTGRMALVGPRPLSEHVAALAPMRVGCAAGIAPGVTGLATVFLCDREDRLLSKLSAPHAAQVYLRRCVGVKRRIDAVYASHRSVRLDLYVLYLTAARWLPLPGRRATRIWYRARWARRVRANHRVGGDARLA